MKTNRYLITILFIFATLLASCNSILRVGELQTESRSVELGDAKSVRVEVNFGAGNLDLVGGADKLLAADFKYNVARFKPDVEFTDSTLVVEQPDGIAIPLLTNVSDFRNEWNLHLSNKVPMDLSVNMGRATSNLDLSGLSLNRLEVSLGAGASVIDLNDQWKHDMDVTIDTGAADITLQLPKDVGVQVQVGSAPTIIVASGLTQEGNVYTNAAYGVSGVTMHITMEPGIGRISLEVADEAAAAQK